jgi:hypothetical protein
MSAFIVEDETINKVIACLNSVENGPENADWITRPLRNIAYIGKLGKTLGEAMFVLNAASVEERYGEGEARSFRPLDYKFKDILPPSPIAAYKALQCFLYQSCEGECDKDELFIALEQVKAELAQYIVNRLPQYESAVWG